MPGTKTPEMIILQANTLKPIRRLSTKEAAVRMLRELAFSENDETV